MKRKTLTLLYCLDKLLIEHRLDKAEVIEEFSISFSAFDRYKKDIRRYMEAYRPEFQLVYSRRYGAYSLVTKRKEEE